MIIPIPIEMNAAMAKRVIAETAADSGRVVLTRHVIMRMRQRNITRPQIDDCLFHGVIIEEPVRTSKGGWECKMRRRFAGDLIDLVVAIKHSEETGQRIIVVTVYHKQL